MVTHRDEAGVVGLGKFAVVRLIDSRVSDILD